MRKTRRMTAVLLSLAMLSLLVFAETNTADMWQSGQTQNLIPAMQGGITLDAQGWGKACDTLDMLKTESGFEGYVIKPSKDSGELGRDNYTGGVYYTVRLSDADVIHAEKGDLRISASSKNWYQSQAYHNASVRVEFFSADGRVLSAARETHYRAGAFQGAKRKVITFGDTLVYGVRFSEAVNIEASGTMNLSVGRKGVCVFFEHKPFDRRTDGILYVYPPERSKQRNDFSCIGKRLEGDGRCSKGNYIQRLSECADLSIL